MKMLWALSGSSVSTYKLMLMESYIEVVSKQPLSLLLVVVVKLILFFWSICLPVETAIGLLYFLTNSQLSIGCIIPRCKWDTIKFPQCDFELEIYFNYKKGGQQHASGLQCCQLKRTTEQIADPNDTTWLLTFLKVGHGAVVKFGLWGKCCCCDSQLSLSCCSKSKSTATTVAAEIHRRPRIIF